MERYTDEQTRYLRTLWGEEYWKNGCYNDGMMGSALLGSGYEVGHKTSGIVSGFSYETKQTEIPGSSQGKKSITKPLKYGHIKQRISGWRILRHTSIL